MLFLHIRHAKIALDEGARNAPREVRLESGRGPPLSCAERGLHGMRNKATPKPRFGRIARNAELGRPEPRPARIARFADLGHPSTASATVALDAGGSGLRILRDWGGVGRRGRGGPPLLWARPPPRHPARASYSQTETQTWFRTPPPTGLAGQLLPALFWVTKDSRQPGSYTQTHSKKEAGER